MTYAEKVENLCSALGRRHEDLTDQVKFRIRAHMGLDDVELEMNTVHPSELLDELHEEITEAYGSEGVATFSMGDRVIRVKVYRNGIDCHHRVDPMGTAAEDLLLKAYAYESI